MNGIDLGYEEKTLPERVEWGWSSEVENGAFCFLSFVC
jgi:hypothetical protein